MKQISIWSLFVICTLRIAAYFKKPLIAMMFFQSILSSQSTPVPVSVPASVTVRMCVDAALTAHPVASMAEARVDAANAKYDESGGALLPQLRFSARAIGLSHVEPTSIKLPIPGSQPITLFPSIDHQYGARLSLTQPLFAGFRLSSAKEMARLAAEASVEERLRDRADLALQVEQAYWTWVQALEAQDVLEKVLVQMTEHEKLVRRLVEQGLSTSSDLLNIRVKRSDVHVRLIDARTGADLARMALNNFIGNPLETPLVPAESPLQYLDVKADSLSNHPDVRADAFADRPDIRALSLRKSISEESLSAARGGWYPQISLAANVDYARPNSRIIPPQDKFSDTWDVGIQLQWTVWDWQTTSAQAEQAQASVRQAEAGLQLMTNAAKLEVAQYSRRLRDAREQVAAARLGVEAAEESRRIVGEKFQAGTSSNTEVLDADVALLQAKLNLTKAGAEFRLAEARLRRATGELP